MLPLSYRLPTSEFSSVLKRGTRINGPALTLIYQMKKADSRFRGNDKENCRDDSRESGNHKPRFGFVVSAKVSPKAVARNRIKRLMREAVHHAVDKVTIGYDYVFIARSGIQELTQKEIENSIISLLERAK